MQTKGKTDSQQSASTIESRTVTADLVTSRPEDNDSQKDKIDIKLQRELQAFEHMHDVSNITSQQFTGNSACA